MNHKFNHQHKARLDSPQRRQELPPEEILTSMGLQKADTMLDIGCGTGYFSIPAARLVGPGGKVYALDIEQPMLDVVLSRAREEQLPWIEVVKSEENRLMLGNHTADFAFLAFVLHEVNDPGAFMPEVARIIKPGGKIALIEWKKEAAEGGPPLEDRLAPETVKDLLTRYGFAHLECRELKTRFYAITALKPLE